MRQDEMIAIVEGHLKAEGAGDVEGAVAVSTDIVHDAVGFPGSPLRARRGRGSSTGSHGQHPHRDRRAASPVLRRRHHGPRADP